MSEIISKRLPPVLGLVLALLFLAPGLRAQEEAAPPRSSLQAFEALHAQVETAAAAGRLPDGSAAAAEELAFDLKTELIRREAEIEVLKLEAARFDGEPQRQALDRLVAAAAARELRVCVAIRQLEELAGVSADLSAAPAAAGAASADAEEQPGAEGKKKGKLSVTFEAEDLVENPDS